MTNKNSILQIITTGANGTTNNSEFLAITCSLLKAQKKSTRTRCDWFWFYRLKNWHKIFKPITTCSNLNNCMISSQEKIKTTRLIFTVNGQVKKPYVFLRFVTCCLCVSISVADRTKRRYPRLQTLQATGDWTKKGKTKGDEITCTKIFSLLSKQCKTWKSLYETLSSYRISQIIKGSNAE